MEKKLNFYVYKTTNLINNKFYVGVHKSKDIENDMYFGSGVFLKRDIYHHGIENFIREILYVFDTAEKAFEKEKEIVSKDFIQRSDTYNRAVGGSGRIWTL